MTIKPLTVENVFEFAEVIRQSFATVAQEFGFTKENCHGYIGFITDERLESKFENENCCPFGVFVDERMIGCVALTNSDESVFEMSTLSVLPAYRHFSYGTALINFCREKVKEFSGNKIIISIVEENTVLKDWYVKNGFIHTGTKNIDGLPFVVGYMERLT